MSAARAIRLVFQRELKARLLSKANIITMAIMVAVIAAGTVVTGILMDRDSGPRTVHIAVGASASELEPFLDAGADQFDVLIELTTSTEDEARAVIEGKVAGAEPLEAFVGGNPTSPDVIVADPDDPVVQGIIGGAVQERALEDAVRAMGGDPDELRRALEAAQPTIESPSLSDEERYGPAYGVAMVALIVLLIALISGCNMIAMGVVEEKSSRVVELLLATIKPTQLLAGKILGVGAYGLVQVAVIGGALTLSLSTLGVAEDIDVNIGGTLVLLIVWFLLGYTTFALLFGAFASLVSRQEDIGAVTTPLSFLVVTPYYVAMFLVPEQPDSSLVAWLSQVPFLSPFMMPIRSAMGSVAPWEMALAIVIALATIPALVWLAARLYQRGVLHMGGRLKVRDALKRAA